MHRNERLRETSTKTRLFRPENRYINAREFLVVCVLCDPKLLGPLSGHYQLGYALYVFSPGTDGKNFKLAPPGLCGEIDSAMANANNRPPERGKKTAAKRAGEGAIFSPSVAGPGKNAFCKPY